MCQRRITKGIVRRDVVHLEMIWRCSDQRRSLFERHIKPHGERCSLMEESVAKYRMLIKYLARDRGIDILTGDYDLGQ